jgi:ketosteroid isomerase-like protein
VSEGDFDTIRAFADDGIRGWIDGEAEAFAEAEVQDIEAHEVSPDLLLGSAHVCGRGRDSGIELGGEAAWVFEMQEGRIARWRSFASRDEAAQAAEEWE